jgi:hypothetical protein
VRDLRDPQNLGTHLLNTRKLWPLDKLSVVADQYHTSLLATENYPQDELLSTVTQREYREELTKAAKEGDKYAAERLREL